jgi:TonB family protein
MLKRLVASDRPRNLFRSTPGAAVSLTVHGLLVAGAVVATRAGVPAPGVPALTDTTALFLPESAEPRRDPGQPQLEIPVIDGRDLAGLAKGMIEVPVDVPNGISPPDAGPVFGFRVSGHPRAVPWPWATGGGDPAGVVHATVADEAPMLLTSPEPHYPHILRAAGIEGTVVFELIVDTTGLPEAESVRVVSSPHAQFEAAARRVVLGARYRPGRWRGRPVRVLIRQPVEFRLM